MTTDFRRLLEILLAGRVEFIVVGGVAAAVHGSARVTLDLDLVYRRTPENLVRLVDVLRPFDPYLRGAPRGLPFTFDVETVRRGLNFTLTTTLGALDLLGEITGGGTYEDLAPDSLSVRLFGYDCRCVGLDRLIALKRAAGRPKDNETVAELEALREERDRSPEQP